MVFPKVEAVKIGMSKNIGRRTATLQKEWGYIDLEKSFFLSLEQDRVHKIEKALHHLFAKKRVDSSRGDGYTELFSLSSYDSILKVISFSDLNQVEKSTFSMEIYDSELDRKTSFVKKRNKLYRSHRTKVTKHVRAKEILSQVECIVRKLLILYTRKDSVNFESKKLKASQHLTIWHDDYEQLDKLRLQLEPLLLFNAIEGSGGYHFGSILLKEGRLTIKIDEPNIHINSDFEEHLHLYAYKQISSAIEMLSWK